MASGASRQTASPSMSSGSRLVTSTTRCGQCRDSRSTRSATASSRCSQLSRSSSRALGASASTSRSSMPRPGCSATPTAAATAPAHQTGIADRGELDHPGAVVVLVHDVEADLDRQAGLPHAARPHDRQHAGGGQEVGERRPFGLPSDEARPQERQVVGDDAERARRREGRRRRSGCTSWKSRSGAGNPRSWKEPSGVTVAPVREPWPGGGGRGVGHQDLAAVRARRDPGGLVHGERDVAVADGVRLDRCAGRCARGRPRRPATRGRPAPADRPGPRRRRPRRRRRRSAARRPRSRPRDRGGGRPPPGAGGGARPAAAT